MKKILCLLFAFVLLISGCGQNVENSEDETDSLVHVEDYVDALEVYMVGDSIITDDEEIYQTFYTLGEFSERSLFWGKEAHVFYSALDKYSAETGINLRITYFSTTFELLKQLQRDAEAGTMPDVVVGSNCSSGYDLYSLIKEGYFMDLSPFFQKSDLTENDKYVCRVLDAGKIQEKQMIFPLSFNMNILISSKENLQEKNIDNLEGMAYQEMVHYFTEEWLNDTRDEDELILLSFSDVLNSYPFSIFEAASGCVYYDPVTGENLIGKEHFNTMAKLCNAYYQNDYGMDQEELEEFMNKVGEATSGIDLQGISKYSDLSSVIKKSGADGFEFVRSYGGYIADGGYRSYSMHSFVAQAGYYESRFKDEKEEFVCFGIPSENISDGYVANVSMFGGVIADSNKAQEAFDLLKMMADTPRHMYYDLSVNREQIDISIKQLCQSSIEFYTMQGNFPLEMVPEEELEMWLGDKYIIHPMSEETKEYLLCLIDQIGIATLPDTAAQNIIWNEIQNYIFGKTDTLDAAYEEAMHKLNELR